MSEKKQNSLEIIKKLETDFEQLEKGFKAKIISVDSTTSHKFFEDSKYDDREGFKVELQLEDGSMEWSEFFSIPAKPSGLLNPDCRITKFKKKYGQLPYAGQIVDVTIDENGFFKVVL